jgi:hypothetical protein
MILQPIDIVVYLWLVIAVASPGMLPWTSSATTPKRPS